MLLVNAGLRLRGAGMVMQFMETTVIVLGGETDRGDRERLVELGLNVARFGLPKGSRVIAIGRRMGRVAFEQLSEAVSAGDMKEWSDVGGSEPMVAIARAQP